MSRRFRIHLVFPALLFFTVLATASTPAKEIRLYDSHGVLSEETEVFLEMNGPVIQIHPGDVLEFTNGRRFTVKAVLGGDTNHILDVGGGRILRIPKINLPFSRATIESYFDGYGSLVENGVPVPRVFEADSDRQEYLLQELVTVKFTLLDLQRASPDEREEALEDLVSFALKTASFEHIGDIGPWQIGWDGERWILLDWTRSHVLHDFEPWNVKSTFWDKLNRDGLIPQDLLARIYESVIEERQRRTCETHLRP